MCVCIYWKKGLIRMTKVHFWEKLTPKSKLTKELSEICGFERILGQLKSKRT